MTLALVPKPATDAEFLTLFNRLCVGLRETQDDTGITQQVYFEALKDVPREALEAGAVALMKQAGRRFFPTTAEWRTEAEKASEQHLRSAVSVGRVDPWRHECQSCEDTGWVMGLTCDGGTACGRKHTHAPHSYTVACACRPTNRTYRRHLLFGGGAA